MLEIPVDLLKAIPRGAESQAREWWSSLSDADRHHLRDLWDARREVRFFSPQRDDSGQLDGWEQVPETEGGRFLPPDDAWGFSEWGPGYFEHLLEHPELVLLWEPAERRFHIGCTRHAAARSCMGSGRVPDDFLCPGAEPDCPLLPLQGADLVEVAALGLGFRNRQTSRYSNQSLPER